MYIADAVTSMKCFMALYVLEFTDADEAANAGMTHAFELYGGIIMLIKDSISNSCE